MAKAEAQTTAGNTKRTKASKAAATGDAPVKDTTSEAGESNKGAPRPRKYDYGIQNENKVSVTPRTEEEGEPKLKAGEAAAYETAKTCGTVEKFLEKHERAFLRRLSRKKLIGITGADGTQYPREYVAPEKPAPKAKKPEAGDDKAA